MRIHGNGKAEAVHAAMRFVRGGGEAIIGKLTEVNAALVGEAGTRIMPAPEKGAWQ